MNKPHHQRILSYQQVQSQKDKQKNPSFQLDNVPVKKSSENRQVKKEGQQIIQNIHINSNEESLIQPQQIAFIQKQANPVGSDSQSNNQNIQIDVGKHHRQISWKDNVYYNQNQDQQFEFQNYKQQIKQNQHATNSYQMQQLSSNMHQKVAFNLETSNNQSQSNKFQSFSNKTSFQDNCAEISQGKSKINQNKKIFDKQNVNKEKFQKQVKFGENQNEIEEKTEIKETEKIMKKVKVAQPQIMIQQSISPINFQQIQNNQSLEKLHLKQSSQHGQSKKTNSIINNKIQKLLNQNNDNQSIFPNEQNIYQMDENEILLKSQPQVNILNSFNNIHSSISRKTIDESQYNMISNPIIVYSDADRPEHLQNQIYQQYNKDQIVKYVRQHKKTKSFKIENNQIFNNQDHITNGHQSNMQMKDQQVQRIEMNKAKQKILGCTESSQVEQNTNLQQNLTHQKSNQIKGKLISNSFDNTSHKAQSVINSNMIVQQQQQINQGNFQQNQNSLEMNHQTKKNVRVASSKRNLSGQNKQIIGQAIIQIDSANDNHRNQNELKQNILFNQQQFSQTPNIKNNAGKKYKKEEVVMFKNQKIVKKGAGHGPMGVIHTTGQPSILGSNIHTHGNITKGHQTGNQSIVRQSFQDLHNINDQSTIYNGVSSQYNDANFNLVNKSPNGHQVIFNDQKSEASKNTKASNINKAHIRTTSDAQYLINIKREDIFNQAESNKDSRSENNKNNYIISSSNHVYKSKKAINLKLMNQNNNQVQQSLNQGATKGILNFGQNQQSIMVANQQQVNFKNQIQNEQILLSNNELQNNNLFQKKSISLNRVSGVNQQKQTKQNQKKINFQGNINVAGEKSNSQGNEQKNLRGSFQIQKKENFNLNQKVHQDGSFEIYNQNQMNEMDFEKQGEESLKISYKNQRQNASQSGSNNITQRHQQILQKRKQSDQFAANHSIENYQKIHEHKNMRDSQLADLKTTEEKYAELQMKYNELLSKHHALAVFQKTEDNRHIHQKQNIQNFNKFNNDNKLNINQIDFKRKVKIDQSMLQKNNYQLFNQNYYPKSQTEEQTLDSQIRIVDQRDQIYQQKLKSSSPMESCRPLNLSKNFVNSKDSKFIISQKFNSNNNFEEGHDLVSSGIVTECFIDQSDAYGDVVVSNEQKLSSEENQKYVNIIQNSINKRNIYERQILSNQSFNKDRFKIQQLNEQDLTTFQSQINSEPNSQNVSIRNLIYQNKQNRIDENKSIMNFNNQLDINLNGISRIEACVDLSGNNVDGLNNKNFTDGVYYPTDNPIQKKSGRKNQQVQENQIIGINQHMIPQHKRSSSDGGIFKKNNFKSKQNSKTNNVQHDEQVSNNSIDISNHMIPKQSQRNQKFLEVHKKFSSINNNQQNKIIPIINNLLKEQQEKNQQSPKQDLFENKIKYLRKENGLEINNNYFKESLNQQKYQSKNMISPQKQINLKEKNYQEKQIHGIQEKDKQLQKGEIRNNMNQEQKEDENLNTEISNENHTGRLHDMQVVPSGKLNNFQINQQTNSNIPIVQGKPQDYNAKLKISDINQKLQVYQNQVKIIEKKNKNKDDSQQVQIKGQNENIIKNNYNSQQSKQLIGQSSQRSIQHSVKLSLISEKERNNIQKFSQQQNNQIIDKIADKIQEREKKNEIKKQNIKNMEIRNVVLLQPQKQIGNHRRVKSGATAYDFQQNNLQNAKIIQSSVISNSNKIIQNDVQFHDYKNIQQNDSNNQIREHIALNTNAVHKMSKQQKYKNDLINSKYAEDIVYQENTGDFGENSIFNNQNDQKKVINVSFNEMDESHEIYEQNSQNVMYQDQQLEVKKNSLIAGNNNKLLSSFLQALQKIKPQNKANFSNANQNTQIDNQNLQEHLNNDKKSQDVNNLQKLQVNQNQHNMENDKLEKYQKMMQKVKNKDLNLKIQKKQEHSKNDQTQQQYLIDENTKIEEGGTIQQSKRISIGIPTEGIIKAKDSMKIQFIGEKDLLLEHNLQKTSKHKPSKSNANAIINQSPLIIPQKQVFQGNKIQFHVPIAKHKINYPINSYSVSNTAGQPSPIISTKKVPQKVFDATISDSYSPNIDDQQQNQHYKNDNKKKAQNRNLIGDQDIIFNNIDENQQIFVQEDSFGNQQIDQSIIFKNLIQNKYKDIKTNQNNTMQQEEDLNETTEHSIKFYIQQIEHAEVNSNQISFRDERRGNNTQLNSERNNIDSESQIPAQFGAQSKQNQGKKVQKFIQPTQQKGQLQKGQKSMRRKSQIEFLTNRGEGEQANNISDRDDNLQTSNRLDMRQIPQNEYIIPTLKIQHQNQHSAISIQEYSDQIQQDHYQKHINQKSTNSLYNQESFNRIMMIQNLNKQDLTYLDEFEFEKIDENNQNFLNRQNYNKNQISKNPQNSQKLIQALDPQPPQISERLVTEESNGASNLTPRSKQIRKLLKLIKISFRQTGQAPDTTIDFYRIGKALGKGAFGKVNLAVHKLTQCLCAIKSISKQFFSDQSQTKKVMQEVVMLKRTRHKNIVRLFEYFETEKYILFVIEVCAGGDLLNYVRRRRRLKEDLAKYLFKQIIESLAYCHSKSILHRDIKLDNILLDMNGQIKICDFGVGKIVKKNEKMTEQCGTPAYIAPEILRDEGYYGFAVDIWSSGVVLYAMLYGTVPFKANNMQELQQIIKQGVYTMKDDISTAARDLLKGLLEVDPEKRLNIGQILAHQWMQDINCQGNIELFTEQEKQYIKSEFTYGKSSRYGRNGLPLGMLGQDSQINQQFSNGEDLLTKDMFTEHQLDSVQKSFQKNCDTKSVVLAPFNSTISDLNENGDPKNFVLSDSIKELIMPKNIIKFGARVRDIDRQYEINNNADLDNGVFHKLDENENNDQVINDNLNPSINNEPYKSKKYENSNEIIDDENLLDAEEKEILLQLKKQGKKQKVKDQSDLQKLENMIQDQENEQIKSQDKNEQLKRRETPEYDCGGNLVTENSNNVQIEVNNHPILNLEKIKNDQMKIIECGTENSDSPRQINQEYQNKCEQIMKDLYKQQLEEENMKIDHQIVDMVVQFGYPKNLLIKWLQSHELNYATTSYLLLYLLKKGEGRSLTKNNADDDKYSICL